MTVHQGITLFGMYSISFMSTARPRRARKFLMPHFILGTDHLKTYGGAGEVQKKNSRKGKLNEKNSCTPINPKKYSCYGLKKIHTRNFITKKIPAARKFPSPPPPITFLMVRPLGREHRETNFVLLFSTYIQSLHLAN